MVNSAAVKLDQIGQEDDQELLEGRGKDEVETLGRDAELHNRSVAWQRL